MAATVLIVDDHAAFRSLARAVLEADGFDVVGEASDGAAALAAARALAPEIVLLDVALPDMDGFAVCQEIRRFSDVPIIMLTVRDRESDIVRGLQLGADDYVAKPFRPIEFMARVQLVLR